MMPHMIPPMSVFLLLHGIAFQSREHAALWRSGLQILYAEASEAFAEPWAAENDTSRQTAKPQPKYITIQENASKNKRTRGGGELVHSGPLIFLVPPDEGALYFRANIIRESIGTCRFHSRSCL